MQVYNWEAFWTSSQGHPSLPWRASLLWLQFCIIRRKQYFMALKPCVCGGGEGRWAIHLACNSLANVGPWRNISFRGCSRNLNSQGSTWWRLSKYSSSPDRFYWLSLRQRAQNNEVVSNFQAAGGACPGFPSFQLRASLNVRASSTLRGQVFY